MKRHILLALAAALTGGALLPQSSGGVRVKKPDWKPKFSGKELARVRSLPKRERKKMVRELTEKYARIHNGRI